ncbi:MAG: AMP-binding protein [Chloroflexota bacterium]
MEYESIVQPFYARAEKNPDDLVVVLISEDEADKHITCAELMAGAQRAAKHLQNSGITDQDVVILVLPCSVTLLEAIWGPLLLGAIPSVLTYVHPVLDKKTYLKQLRSTLQSSKVQAIVTIPEMKSGLEELATDLDCAVITGIDKDIKSGGEILLPNKSELSSEKIAVLQFSSGSTGKRKGVMLSHRAIFSYNRGLEGVINHYSEYVHVSWLPLYHDLGLIYGFLLPIIGGHSSVLMSPMHWIYRPEILFKAISKYRGSITWMPNFAFKHSLRIAEEDLDGVDLSSWRTVGNGAEPVEADSLELFYEKFSPYGLKKTALAAGYGLAEQVAGVARTSVIGPPNVDWVDRIKLQEEGLAAPLPKESTNGKVFESCGAPFKGVEIQIVNDHAAVLPERHVGEIVIRGDQMFSGYYQQPELTAQVVRDGWFYTGDLGYLFKGEIYICGRKKDLIIIGGDNIYPQDIEAVVAEFSIVRPGSPVAFGIDDKALGTERVVVAAELKQSLDNHEKAKITTEIRQRVFNELNIRVAKVYLMEEKGWVVKTSSGKLARSANKAKYIEAIE